MLSIGPIHYTRTAWLWWRFSACLRSPQYTIQGPHGFGGGCGHACGRPTTLCKGRVAVAEALVVLATDPLHYPRTAWLQRRLWSCARSTRYIVQGPRGFGEGPGHGRDQPNTLYKGRVAVAEALVMLAVDPMHYARAARLCRRLPSCLRSTQYITQGPRGCGGGSHNACDGRDTLYKDRVAVAEAVVMLAVGPLHYARTMWLWRRLWSCLRSAQCIIQGPRGCGGGPGHARDRPTKS